MSQPNKLEDAYLRFHKLCYYQALEILKDHALAEDAVQESFLILADHLDRIDTGSSRRTGNYLLTITKNLCLTWYQKRNREVEYSDGEEEDAPSLEDQTLRELDFGTLKTMIGELPAIYRVPLCLRYYNGFSYGEIADFMEISENLVSVRLSRAKKKLQQMLAEGGDPSCQNGRT